MYDHVKEADLHVLLCGVADVRRDHFLDRSISMKRSDDLVDGGRRVLRVG
jgi:hypothetical protein